MGDIIAETIWYTIIFIIVSTAVLVVSGILIAVLGQLILHSLYDLYPKEEAKSIRSKMYWQDSITGFHYITKENLKDSEEICKKKKQLKKIGKLYYLIFKLAIIFILLCFLIVVLIGYL